MTMAFHSTNVRSRPFIVAMRPKSIVLYREVKEVSESLRYSVSEKLQLTVDPSPSRVGVNCPGPQGGETR